jgi:hypothetical protein
MDMHSVMQGQPGYSQQDVCVGDLVVAIDGQMCVDMPLDTLQQMLKGTLPLALTRARTVNHDYTSDYTSFLSPDPTVPCDIST